MSFIGFGIHVKQSEPNRIPLLYINKVWEEKNEAVDIHMPAASENVNLKFNTYENNEDSSSHDDDILL